MGRGNLPMTVLKNIRVCSLQDDRRAATEARGMVAQRHPSPTGLDPDQLDTFVLEELVKDTDGIGSAAYAGDDRGWKLPFSLQNLRPGFAANHRMKIADHGGIRMSAQHTAQQVMSVADIGDPVAHCLVDGVLQSTGTGVDAAHLCSEEPHAEDIQLLAAHIFQAHIDHAFESKERADGGAGYAMLACAGLRNNALLAHTLRQQGLPQAVVDFV